MDKKELRDSAESYMNVTDDELRNVMTLDDGREKTNVYYSRNRRIVVPACCEFAGLMDLRRFRDVNIAVYTQQNDDPPDYYARDQIIHFDRRWAEPWESARYPDKTCPEENVSIYFHDPTKLEHRTVRLFEGLSRKERIATLEACQPSLIADISELLYRAHQVRYKINEQVPDYEGNGLANACHIAERDPDRFSPETRKLFMDVHEKWVKSKLFGYSPHKHLAFERMRILTYDLLCLALADLGTYAVKRYHPPKETKKSEGA